MDSTLTSDTPGLISLPCPGRSGQPGKFAGAVVDWYDFLLYGITAALVFNHEFFHR